MSFDINAFITDMRDRKVVQEPFFINKSEKDELRDQYEDLSKQLGDLLNGRLESEIPINDGYWNRRADIHTQMGRIEQELKK